MWSAEDAWKEVQRLEEVIRGNNRRIKELKEALTWYADPHNLAQYIGETTRHTGGESYVVTYMLPGVAKVAMKALKECDHNWVRLELENRTVCARCEKEK
jgi:hypothetical protein